MPTNAPLSPIHSMEDLERYGVPAPMNRDKVLTRLHDVHREWLAATPLIFVASSSNDGRCDVSPKGDPPGFIHVHDDTTILIPERPGNQRMDGFHNILANPHVGIVCLIPGRGDTLRINGRATIMANPAGSDTMTVKGHRPVLALQVTVEEVFFHCPKAFRRAKAWDPDRWNPDAARSYAEVAMTLWRKDEPREAVMAHYEDNVYNEALYAAQQPPDAPETRASEPPAGQGQTQRHRRDQLVTIGFIAFHFPHPSHRDEMIDRIEHVVEVITAQPGCLGAECWLTDTYDGEAVVSSARWTSADARDAAIAAARDAGADFRFDEREAKPRRIWDLTAPTRT